MVTDSHEMPCVQMLQNKAQSLGGGHLAVSDLNLKNFLSSPELVIFMHTLMCIVSYNSS